MLSASSSESYTATLTSTYTLVAKSPHHASALARSVFTPYHLPDSSLGPILTHLESSHPDLFADFLMRFHHCLPAPSCDRAYVSASTIALAYFLGGLLPLLPYFFVRGDEVRRAFWWSVAVMAVALAGFGYGKTCVVRGWKGEGDVGAGVRGAVQMVLVGGVAAWCTMGLVKALG